MTRPSRIPPTYRGRDQMTLQEFIADVEKVNFRTPFDTGANHNAMFVWNILRNFAGMEELTEDDLVQHYADSDNVPFDEMKRRCDEYREWYTEYSERNALARLKRKYEGR